MTTTYPLEFIFAQTFLKEIRERRKRQVDHLLAETLPHVEYAEQRGYVQALTDADTIFVDLMKQMLPEFR